MNKLEYEMNQVAVKTRMQDAINFIKFNKQKGIDRMATLQDVTALFSNSLNREEIEKLVQENY